MLGRTKKKANGNSLAVSCQKAKEMQQLKFFKVVKLYRNYKENELTEGKLAKVGTCYQLLYFLRVSAGSGPR